MKINLYTTENFMFKRNNYLRKVFFSNEKYVDVKNGSKFKDKTVSSFYVSTPSKMTFTDSSLFTKQYIEKMKEIIGDGKVFKRRSSEDRNNITSKLEDLYSLENT